MSQAARPPVNRLFLWLSLAVILTHALIPLGSPLVRGPGSAFSAYTGDVSLGSRTAAKAKRQKTEQAKPPDVSTGVAIAIADAGGVIPPAPHGALAPTSAPAGSAPPRLELPAQAPHDAFRARAPPTA